MGPPLNDDIWTRRGISILWDADHLARVCSPKEVVSVRQFLRLHASGWPESELSLVNDKALVVAGLESCIDALPPAEAEEWLEKTVYSAIISYQREVSDGGSQAALIFWFADHRRLTFEASDNTYSWHCGTEFRGQQVALSRCLFNGAQHDLRQIHVLNDKKAEVWIGLYHPRIS
jgi:hypothetical protein